MQCHTPSLLSSSCSLLFLAPLLLAHRLLVPLPAQTGGWSPWMWYRWRWPGLGLGCAELLCSPPQSPPSSHHPDRERDSLIWLIQVWTCFWKKYNKNTAPWTHWHTPSLLSSSFFMAEKGAIGSVEREVLMVCPWSNQKVKEKMVGERNSILLQQGKVERVIKHIHSDALYFWYVIFLMFSYDIDKWPHCIDLYTKKKENSGPVIGKYVFKSRQATPSNCHCLDLCYSTNECWRHTVPSAIIGTLSEYEQNRL